MNAFEPGGPQYLDNVQQGYLSVLVPAGKGLQIDFGKFVTPHGAEVIETRDNWNYSRGLLFALAIPYYHMGARSGPGHRQGGRHGVRGERLERRPRQQQREDCRGLRRHQAE